MSQGDYLHQFKLIIQHCGVLCGHNSEGDSISALKHRRSLNTI